MSIDPSGALRVRGDLREAPPCTEPSCIAPSAGTWVRGYPSVLYGINQCHASTSPATSPRLSLPAKVGALPPDLVGTTSYSASATDVTFDIAYDLWLSDSPTRNPCQTNGTVEVMIWTDYDQRALLPGSLEIGTASAPIAVDGTSSSGQNAWTVYATDIDRDGKTAPWGGTLWFVLDNHDVVDHGTVSVDVSSILSSAGDLLSRVFGWGNFGSSYWLDTIPFGMEFGPASAAVTGSGPSDFSFTVSSFCLDTGAAVSTTSC